MRRPKRDCIAAPPRYNGSMNTISIQDIQRDPLGCLRRVEDGETLVIVRDERPVAEIKPIPSPALQPRQPGSALGQLVILAEDDEHLRDFQEYMP